jgi:hypothetical protein
MSQKSSFLDKDLFLYEDVFLYFFIDEYLNMLQHAETSVSAIGVPPTMSDSEILFVFILACRDHSGNYEKALNSAQRNGLIRQRLSRGQYCRRLHKVYDLAVAILMFLGELAKENQLKYAMDSFPIATCKNIRISRSKLVQGNEYRGYNKSKREYFFGFKVHMITALDGRIVEMEFTPGSYFDTCAFNLLNFELPEGSEIFADKAYNAYDKEDQLSDAGLNLEVIRKQNSLKEDNKYVFNWLKQLDRKHIETDISVIEQAFPKTIHAVTKKGFLLKIIGFCIAHNFSFYF